MEWRTPTKTEAALYTIERVPKNENEAFHADILPSDDDATEENGSAPT